ncbi:MAG TPA: hypothetical protein VKA08_02000 [Balneolales bacterium]|nr:hypothetical protein [Balneolales bacterium]
MELISSLNGAIKIVKRLREISKNIEEAEFNNLLADLSNELADSKIHIAELKHQILQLEQENEHLRVKWKAQNEKKTMKWGCYQFEGDDGLYCTACYDTKGDKIRTTRLDIMHRKCPVCKAVLSG